MPPKLVVRDVNSVSGRDDNAMSEKDITDINTSTNK